MGTQMLAVTDVIKLHYTTITPQLLLNGTGLKGQCAPGMYRYPCCVVFEECNNLILRVISSSSFSFFNKTLLLRLLAAAPWKWWVEQRWDMATGNLL